MKQLLPLQAVRVFEVAARHENFSRAAAELGMTQAAVSYQIRLLESRLGFDLFVRSKGRVTLSQAGRHALPLVASGLRDIGAAFHASRVAAGALTISTSEVFASNWLAPRVQEFAMSLDGLAVRLLSSVSPHRDPPADADILIDAHTQPPRWHGYQVEHVFRLHSTPMCTPEFRDRHGIEKPSDLLRVPRLNPEASWWRSWFAECGLGCPEPDETSEVRLNSQSLEGHSVLANLGVGMLTPLLWSSDLAQNRLVQLFERVTLEESSYWLIYPIQRGSERMIRAFRDWFLPAARECAPVASLSSA